MDMLIQLGVNSTLATQLILFLVVFVALKYLLFEPYFAAFDERQKRTLGKTEQAEKYMAESRSLEEKFAAQARLANDQYRAVFDKSRTEAQKEYAQLVTQAREHAKIKTEDVRQKVRSEISHVKTQLSLEVPAISKIINQKLVGKEFNA